MYGFLIKKSFCDAWDNLLSVIVTNLLCLFTGVGVLLLSATIFKSFSESSSQNLQNLVVILIFALVCIIFSIFAFAYGELSAKIANFEGVHLLDFFREIPGVLKDALLFALMIVAIVIVSSFCIEYYFAPNRSMISYFVGALLIWMDVFLILSLQWFIPIRSLMHNNFKKCLKKCFIVFFDNTGFSVFMAFYNLVMIVLSVFFVGFVPSLAGILIADTNAMRLRLYKYDYLEEHPELKTKKERKQIPWEELLYDDKETLGPRNFKSFFFPWRE